jgi:hypothetical protein
MHTHRFFSFSEEDNRSKSSFQKHGDRDFKKIRIAGSATNPELWTATNGINFKHILWRRSIRDS